MSIATKALESKVNLNRFAVNLIEIPILKSQSINKQNKKKDSKNSKNLNQS